MLMIMLANLPILTVGWLMTRDVLRNYVNKTDKYNILKRNLQRKEAREKKKKQNEDLEEELEELKTNSEERKLKVKKRRLKVKKQKLMAK